MFDAGLERAKAVYVSRKSSLASLEKEKKTGEKFWQGLSFLMYLLSIHQLLSQGWVKLKISRKNSDS